MYILSRPCLSSLRPSIYALTFFFQMKGVTEIHISCAFHEHNKCNTKLLTIDNWNQRHIVVFMTALFLKNCRQCKNWKFSPFFYPFYPWENKKLTKNKTGKKKFFFALFGSFLGRKRNLVKEQRVTVKI